MNYYTNLDLNLNMLKQVRLDPLWSDPPLNELIEGRIWYNRTEDVFKYFDGLNIHILGESGGGGEQSDWLETNPALPSFIKNKPAIISQGDNIVVAGKVIVGEGPTDSNDLTTKEYVDSKVGINLIVEVDPTDIKTGTLKVVQG